MLLGAKGDMLILSAPIGRSHSHYKGDKLWWSNDLLGGWVILSELSSKIDHCLYGVNICSSTNSAMPMGANVIL